MPHNSPLTSSFRDPAGFVFKRDGELFRQINSEYITHYDHLTDSGLYTKLVDRGWLVAHEEQLSPEVGYRVIKPEVIKQISYPYEWSFSQLREAALLILRIQELALEHDMTLKDASAFNVQFRGCCPVLIDTLSFERLDESKPWIAYKQFCEHFLGPLALMCQVDPRQRKLFLGFIDGIPLQLTSRTLPLRTWLNYSTLVHIHLHSRSQLRHADAAAVAPRRQPTMSRKLHSALTVSLRRAVEKSKMPNLETEWGNYYEETNYSESALAAKEELVTEWLQTYWRPGQTIHDLGANTGRFSKLSADTTDAYVVSYDVDEVAVEKNFLNLCKETAYQRRILPMVLDLTNPSPSLGWAHAERDSLTLRCEHGFILALALIHHLAIGNNTPLGNIASFLAEISQTLLIEFVPKTDSQVQRLLATRNDTFVDYTRQEFEKSFSKYFQLQRSEAIRDSERRLYLWTRLEEVNKRLPS
ncbi:MAG: SAM-dependent methyltransferase [Pseudomonadota bacterium]